MIEPDLIAHITVTRFRYVQGLRHRTEQFCPILLKDMSTGVPSRTILPDPDVAAVNSLGNFKIAADLLAFVDGGGIDLLPLSINDSAHRPP